MSEGIVARGERTIVRWFQRDDVDKRQLWPRHDDPLYSHNDPRPMTTRERDLWFVEHTTNANYRLFAVDDLYGDLIGWITLRHVNVNAATSVLGIALRPDTMGKGYGTDCLMAFLGVYFGPMGFREMRLDVAAFNDRAMRVYEKCGYRYVGQHWTEHPASAFPPVLNNGRYNNIARYFRRTLLGLEVLYYDMVIERSAFIRRLAELGKTVEGLEPESAEVPMRRYSRR